MMWHGIMTANHSRYFSKGGLTIISTYKLVLYRLLLHFNSYLKQLYIINKMEHFSCKGGCGLCEQHIHVSRRLKEKLTWVMEIKY